VVRATQASRTNTAERGSEFEETMAKTDFTSVDEYLATQPEDARAILQQVRRAIRKALPGAVEVISYQIPAYVLHGQRVIFFAGWKEHYSLYPVGQHLVEALKDDLAPYERSKGTIRFPLSRPIPAALIERIARLRAQQAETRSASKPKSRVRASRPGAGRRAARRSRRRPGRG
jgi:uncharacterized protein YdhG (YjbR/CyaY superfamily)